MEPSMSVKRKVTVPAGSSVSTLRITPPHVMIRGQTPGPSRRIAPRAPSSTTVLRVFVGECCGDCRWQLRLLYRGLSLRDPSSFSAPLSMVEAFYFALATLPGRGRGLGCRLTSRRRRGRRQRWEAPRRRPPSATRVLPTPPGPVRVTTLTSVKESREVSSEIA